MSCTRHKIVGFVGIILFAAWGCDGSSEQTYGFEGGAEGWSADFADYPAEDDEESLRLEAERRPLPGDLEGYGYYLQGENHSDDLFMYLTARKEGLQPNTEYKLRFTIELATSIPEGLVGIGGAPGESVYVKAGATAVKPMLVEDENGWLRLNIDKGNQSQGGEDMIVLGHIGSEKIDEAGTWVIKRLDSKGQEFTATTDDSGGLWLVVGTDSGFEGMTAVYYDSITVRFTPRPGR